MIGLAKNSRLTSQVSGELKEMEKQVQITGKSARTFKELEYCTLDSWSRKRRVIAKAEHLPGKANSRFVVTSLSTEDCGAREMYEERHCARGEMENRIKEQQLDLFADRTSCHVFRANQVRVYMSSLASVLLNELRRIGLAGTDMARSMRHDPRQAVDDWCSCPSVGPQNLGVDGREFPVTRALLSNLASTAADMSRFGGEN